MFLLLLCSCYADPTLVARWFAQQPLRWFHVYERCEQLAVLFSDAAWLTLTARTAHELVAPGTCVALWLWLDGNTSAVEWCEKHDIPCFVDRRCSATSRWGSRVYFNKIAHRMPVMSAIIDRLPLSAHRGVALIDSDVALLRSSTLVRFERTNATVVVQQEWPCATAPRQLCANGGVWWVRRTEEGRRFLRKTDALMRALAIPDQDALDVVLAQQSAVHYLDRWRYANGHVVQYDARWRRAAAHLVHANWLQGIEAKEKLLTAVRQ